ncbi:MAG TPA: FAD-dependent oxidoreductase, partial [Pseudolabrys sp.]|nr:FAD-dependent oxidoreductase [Pseudolabrys sp.]
MAARHVIVAGAGIAGLTAALTLARAGMRVTVFEQAAKLEETGAGLQLSPNASRVLIALGLRERLASVAVAPQAIRVMAGGSARQIVRIPLGDEMERRYGAPYWSIHRGDLQSALAEAVRKERDVVLELGARLEEFAAHTNGVSVLGRRGSQVLDERGIALIGADGIWSTVAAGLRSQPPPTFRHRTAWRALVPADAVPAEFRQPLVHLWLGMDAHLVHYPVRAGSLINIVGIVHDEWDETG